MLTLTDLAQPRGSNGRDYPMNQTNERARRLTEAACAMVEAIQREEGAGPNQCPDLARQCRQWVSVLPYMTPGALDEETRAIAQLLAAGSEVTDNPGGWRIGEAHTHGNIGCGAVIWCSGAYAVLFDDTYPAAPFLPVWGYPMDAGDPESPWGFGYANDSDADRATFAAALDDVWQHVTETH